MTTRPSPPPLLAPLSTESGARLLADRVALGALARCMRHQLWVDAGRYRGARIARARLSLCKQRFISSRERRVPRTARVRSLPRRWQTIRTQRGVTCVRAHAGRCVCRLDCGASTARRASVGCWAGWAGSCAHGAARASSARARVPRPSRVGCQCHCLAALHAAAGSPGCLYRDVIRSGTVPTVSRMCRTAVYSLYARANGYTVQRCIHKGRTGTRSPHATGTATPPTVT